MDPNGTGGQSDTNDNDAQGGVGQSQGTEGDSTAEGGQSTTSDDNKGKDDSGLSAQLEKQRERTRAADQRAARFEQELKQLRDKDLPEAEKLKRDYEEATKRVGELEEELRAARLNNAFLSDNTHSWHDPKVALKLADLTNVTIEDDGTVTGLGDSLKALAKSHPYLVKAAEEKQREESKPGGTPPGNNGTGGNGRPDRKAVVGRLPALNTRPRS